MILDDEIEESARRHYEELGTAVNGFRAWSPQMKLAHLRKMVVDHTSWLIDGVIVDVQTAHAIIVVYEALKPVNQAKFMNEPIDRMGELAWKCLAK